MNGTTNEDRTLYFETLPANQLELALFLEGDRMRSLDINKANLDNQRNAVQEERRLRVDNQPYGQTFEKTGEQAYDNPAYKHSVIGSMEDLSAASVDDVATFFKTYYARTTPCSRSSATSTPRRRWRWSRSTSARSRGSPQPKRPDLTEPPHTAERRSTIEDPLARLPRVDIAWIGPPARSADSDALDVLTDVLSAGRSSRFNQVDRPREAARDQAPAAFAAESTRPGAVQAFATVAPGKKPGGRRGGASTRRSRR